MHRESRATPGDSRSRSVSTERPLFLIGEQHSVAPHSAGEDVTVIELDVSRIEGGTFRTVQGMAAYLVRQMRELQPSGAYRVAARGRTGALAYEVGVQLVGADETVEFVGLI